MLSKNKLGFEIPIYLAIVASGAFFMMIAESLSEILITLVLTAGALLLALWKFSEEVVIEEEEDTDNYEIYVEYWVQITRTAFCEDMTYEERCKKIQDVLTEVGKLNSNLLKRRKDDVSEM